MTTLTKDSGSESVALLASQMSVSFFLETFIHAKEKVRSNLLFLKLIVESSFFVTTTRPNVGIRLLC